MSHYDPLHAEIYGTLPRCYLCGEPVQLHQPIVRSNKQGEAHYSCWQHPKNWSAPVPISEARKTDPEVEEIMQKLERGELHLS